jgi:N-acetylneuraminate synthase
MKALVDACREVHAAMGSRARVLLPEEEEMKLRMRRSITAAREIPAGTVITAADCEAKRPGDGISPDRIGEVIGKTAVRTVTKGSLIRPEDLGI